MFQNKSILVTGGTGSFGTAFVLKILKTCSPKSVVIFSRDEYKQAKIREKFNTEKNIPLRFVLGDIRDFRKIEVALQGMDYVVHAAALKSVSTSETEPSEFIQTNILGTENLIQAAESAGVKKIVALSSDKACEPVNCYGATKLCVEKLFRAERLKRKTVLSLVRYGNVMGSRGSVIPYFQSMRRSGKLKITDRHMTRFFMTMAHAVQVVMLALRSAKCGEIFVPKIRGMKIVDLAKTFAPECTIEWVGRRPGEKIHETLISKDEAHLTREFESHYVIYPSHMDKMPGVRVPVNFEYVSNQNPHVLNDKNFDEKFRQNINTHEPHSFYMEDINTLQ